MGSPKNNTTIYCDSRTNVVESVEDLLRHLKLDSQWTMTIRQAKSEDYSVHIAIEGSLDDYEQEQVASFFSQTQVNI